MAEKNDTLVLSHLGYIVKEVPIANRKAVAVILEVESLDEVLITASINYSVCYRRGCTSSCKMECMSKGTLITVLNTDEKNNPVLFPNPSSSGYFSIKLSNSFNEVKLQVFSMQGQLLTSSRYDYFQGTVDVDLSSYATGMYLIQVDADGKMLPTIRALRG